MVSEEKQKSINQDRAEFIKKNQASPLLMAKELAKDHPEIVRADENLYRNNSKCYDLLSDKDLDEMFCEFCHQYGADKAWKGVGSTIRAFLVHPTIKKIGKMNNYDNLINCNNGVVDIYAKTFALHPTDKYFDSIIGVDYNADAKDCPVFLKYLTDTFNGDKDTMGNIIRLGGYLLDTSCKAERMFLFDGNGANGKSVLINIFSMFFSDDQITPLSLDKLASESFSKELLIKSRVNFCAEQKKSYLDSEEIKKIVTGDRIEIERKFKISLTFTPKTKIIVACNGLPKFNDTTHAIYRRMILIRFHNQYVSESAYQKIKNPEKMNVHLMDKNLIEKIRLEKSAILNMFIEGLIDLRTHNYEFVESQDSIEAMLEFKRDSDTVREFLEDNYEASENIETSINDIYESYRQWYGRFVSGAPMKFRINELGKRICDIFSVKSSGQKWSYSNEQQKSIRQTYYPIKIKTEPLEDIPIITAEEAKVQLGIDLTKPV